MGVVERVRGKAGWGWWRTESVGEISTYHSLLQELFVWHELIHTQEILYLDAAKLWRLEGA